MKLLEALTLDSLTTILEYYKPHYQADLKTPGGSVKDWFKAMGVEDSHVKEAMEAAKNLPSYKKLSGMFTVKGGDRLDKNGTFSFVSANKNTYSVYGNGVIRQEAPRKGMNHYITKLKAPKPALVHGSPVKSLIKIYDNAFKELASKNLKESVDLTESVNFGAMQKIIYAYVFKTMKGVPADAKHEAENDTFWVNEFDDAHKDFENEDVDSLIDSLSQSIEAVSNSIVDHYSDSMNHAPGYKAIKLKAIENVPEKDLMAMIQSIDPKMIERDAEEKQKATEKSAAASAEQKKHATERIEDIAKVLKKYEAAGWKEFFRAIKIELKGRNKSYAKDYFPKGTTIEQVEAIKSEADMKALFTKPTDLVQALTDSIFNLPGSIKLSNEESYLAGLAYVVSKNASLSKKIVALFK